MAFPERDEADRRSDIRDRAIAIEFWFASALVAGSLLYGLFCGVRSVMT